MLNANASYFIYVGQHIMDICQNHFCKDYLISLPVSLWFLAATLRRCGMCDYASDKHYLVIIMSLSLSISFYLQGIKNINLYLNLGHILTSNDEFEVRVYIKQREQDCSL